MEGCPALRNAKQESVDNRQCCRLGHVLSSCYGHALIQGGSCTSLHSSPFQHLPTGKELGDKEKTEGGGGGGCLGGGGVQASYICHGKLHNQAEHGLSPKPSLAHFTVLMPLVQTAGKSLPSHRPDLHQHHDAATRP